jgi:hypothetical protein
MHPETLYVLAKLKMAENQREADHDRLVRRVGAQSNPVRIDSTPFRQRLTRLFGNGSSVGRPSEA